MKCRADVLGILPDEGSIIRLSGDVLLKQTDEGQADHRTMQTERMADLVVQFTDAQPAQFTTVAAPFTAIQTHTQFRPC